MQQDNERNGSVVLSDIPTGMKRGPHTINTEALKRLKNVEGQVKGLMRMVEAEKYCVDILTQISAARAALNRVGMLILKRHIENCVSNAIKKDGSEGKEIIDELMQMIAKEEI